MAQPLAGVLPERLRLGDLAVDVDVRPRVCDVRVCIEGNGDGASRAISVGGLSGLTVRCGETAVAAWRAASGGSRRRRRAGVVGQVKLMV